MSSGNNRFLVLAVAMAGLVAVGYLAYSGFRGPSAPTIPEAPAAGAAKAAASARPGPPAAFPMAVETARVEASELAVDATAVGSLGSNESVVLRPEIAGRIAAINFKDGVAVSKGALLVELDAATQAAEFDQAKAGLALAQANYQRTQDLFAKKFISGQALDNSQAALKVQDAALALAQAKLDKTRIRAPFSGVVGIRNVSVGDYVKEGQELVNIEDIATLKVDFRLPESYLPQLSPGQQLELSSDALPGLVFTAVLEAINPLVEASGRAISLRARLSNSERRLRPGMFVRVRLIFEKRDNVLLIPEQALVPDSKAPYVFRVVDGQAQRVAIKTGLRRNAQVEVVEGLSAGDEVVTAGQLKLRDGAPVRAVGGAAPTTAPTPGRAAVSDDKAGSPTGAGK